MNRKTCKDLNLASFAKALRWIKAHNPKEANPVHIPKYGGRSQLPFRAWCFAGNILLASNETAGTESEYLLSKEKWDAFSKFVHEHSDMGIGELAKHYQEFACTNKLYWPSVISISKAILNNEPHNNR